MASSSSQVAIVTGGNSGMGMGLVRKLVEKGWKVAVADINENKTFADELGGASSFHKCNVADYDRSEMFQQVWDKYGRIDALCANAGIVDKSSIFIFEYRNSDKIPPKPDLLTTDVDYKGVVYGTQLAIHFMRKNQTPGGKIIATASVAAVVPHEAYPEYAGAKAAVVNFVRATARILKRFLEDDTLYGRVVECSADKHFFLEPPTLANGRVSKRAVTVWDPLFKM
ncbi:hypothetical protein N0V83_002813 [Neocucurbitaria cava]|uniref:15-hydroxyprostaglandin dehydrogenase n=1 Tax=Neocucurbitaria cava TaxID=798079 RepID=A0A9W9CQ00_9PLEO|nr:hypothetical protein N0V83_002813 [Neocucurbitaria cava]